MWTQTQNQTQTVKLQNQQNVIGGITEVFTTNRKPQGIVRCTGEGEACDTRSSGTEGDEC